MGVNYLLAALVAALGVSQTSALAMPVIDKRDVCTRNVVVNPGFETGAASWSGTGEVAFPSNAQSTFKTPYGSRYATMTSGPGSSSVLSQTISGLNTTVGIYDVSFEYAIVSNTTSSCTLLFEISNGYRPGEVIIGGGPSSWEMVSWSGGFVATGPTETLSFTLSCSGEVTAAIDNVNLSGNEYYCTNPI